MWSAIVGTTVIVATSLSLTTLLIPLSLPSSLVWPMLELLLLRQVSTLCMCVCLRVHVYVCVFMCACVCVCINAMGW